MKKFFIVIYLLIPVLSLSQININKTHLEIKNEIEPLKKEKAVKVSLQETDSTLLATVTKKGADSYSHFFTFDKNDSCKLEKISFACDSCFTKKLEEILEIDSYRWKKINENQYISIFEAYLMIELHSNTNDFTISILRTEWTRLLYEMLIGN